MKETSYDGSHITITTEEYENLVKATSELWILQEQGVDAWEGYSNARKEYKDWLKKEYPNDESL